MPTQFADRMTLIDASGIRKVFDLAATMKNPIDLSIGQPDFDVPDAMKAIAVQAVEAGFNRYTQTQGIPELRAGVLASLRAAGRVPADDALDVMITSGTSGGLLLAILALVNPGDEVLFADPYFVMYKHLVNLVGARPVGIDTYPDFALTAARVARALTPRTKMLIVNSPGNPTGVVLPPAALRDIAAVCNQRGIWVLTDEIYSAFCYDTPFSSIFPLLERGLLLDGFSKSHAMTGWRVGYAVGPRALIQEMNKVQQYTFVCAPSMAQKAAVAALDHDVSAHIAGYKRKRDMVYDNLCGQYELSKPAGAFYAFVRAPGDDATAFVQRAIAQNLLIIPGSVFSERDTHFRLAYTADDATIQRGLDVLLALA
jgi:aspartate aminotransferase/aminotransferase